MFGVKFSSSFSGAPLYISTQLKKKKVSITYSSFSREEVKIRFCVCLSQPFHYQSQSWRHVMNSSNF